MNRTAGPLSQSKSPMRAQLRKPASIATILSIFGLACPAPEPLTKDAEHVSDSSVDLSRSDANYNDNQGRDAVSDAHHSDAFIDAITADLENIDGQRLDVILADTNDDAALHADARVDNTTSPDHLLQEDADVNDATVIEELVDSGRYELDISMGTLVITVLSPTIIRFRYQPTSGRTPERGWTTDNITWPTQIFAPNDDGTSVHFRTSAVRVELNKADGAVRISDLEGHILSQDLSAPAQRSVEKDLPFDAHYFGFGEKTGGLDKRGQSLQMWTSDPWWPEPNFTSSSDPIYQSIPFFITLQQAGAHGLYLLNTHRSGFDLGKSTADVVRIWADGGELDYVFIQGPLVADVVENFTRLVGRTPRPPLWTLGYHQCRWSYAPADEVRSIVNEFRTRNIGLDGMWLDIDYMNGFRSFTWDPIGFADPAALLSDLHDLGVKTTAIIDPGIKHQPEGGYAVYEQGIADEHFVRNSDNSPYVGQVWPGAAVFPDFTKPSTRNWWADHVANLVQDGLDGIWIDMNEPTTWIEGGFPLDSRFDGEGFATDHREARNVYALLMAAATQEGLRRAHPSARPFVLTRAGFAGIQRFATVWTGDAISSWSHLAMTPAMLMNMGLSGVAFAGSDVGGFSGGGSAELFTRWMHVGMLSAFFRSHVRSGAPRQEPWSFGPEVESMSRDIIALRYELLPYFYSLMVEANQKGYAPMRPLLFDYQHDVSTYNINDQLLLGSQIVAAPVLEASATQRSVYLPEGVWLDFYNATRHVGNRTISVYAPLQRLPMFVRGNGIVPAWPSQHYVGEITPETLYLDLYPAAAAQSNRFELRLDDGESLTFASGVEFAQSFTLSSDAQGCTLLVGGEQGSYQPSHQAIQARVHGVATAPSAVLLDGAALARLDDVSESSGPNAWSYDANALVLHIRMNRKATAQNVQVTYDVNAVATRTVGVEFEVHLPASTPVDATIFLASDLQDWHTDGIALMREGNVARVRLELAEASTMEFKVTRGSWDNVEKDAQCQERDNRQLRVLGARNNQQHVVIVVDKWRDTDACP